MIGTGIGRCAEPFARTWRHVAGGVTLIRLRSGVLMSCGVAFVALAAFKVFSQDSLGTLAPAGWRDRMDPGREHESLSRLSGRYSVKVKIWMGAHTVESEGRAVLKSIMDGRFIEEEFKGPILGKSVVGRGMFGYDRLQDRWTLIWLDNTNTGALLLTGTSADEGKTVVFEGDISDAPDAPVVRGRWVLHRTSDESFVVDMFEIRSGVENQWMQMSYTRVEE